MPLRPRTIALLIIPALALIAAACGDGGGLDASGKPADRFDPVSVSAVKLELSPDQRWLWADISFKPDYREPVTVTCEASGPEGAKLVAGKAYALIEPGRSRHSFDLGVSPNGRYAVTCASRTAAAANIELARDPKKVVVREIDGRYELPDYGLDRNAPPVVTGARQERVHLVVYQSGLSWRVGDAGPLIELDEVEKGVYRAELDPFGELHQTFTARLEGDDLIVRMEARWDNGRVDQLDQRWVRLPDPAPTPALTATRGP